MTESLRLDRRLLTILLIVFVQMAGAAMVVPILPLFAQREFALTPPIITLLISSFFAAQFVAGPLLGRWSDARGRLPVLVLSQVGTALSFLMTGLAPGFEFLFMARLLDGITGGNLIVAQAYVTDITPRERRTEALGYIFAAFGLGFIIGPAAGGLLSAALGPRIPFIVAGVAAALTALLTRLMLEETVTVARPTTGQAPSRSKLGAADVIANRPLLLILFIAFGGQFAFGLLQATFALYGAAVLFAGYGEELTNMGIGLLLAVVGVSQFVTQLVILPRLIRRVNVVWLVVLGNVVRGAGLMVYAVISSPWPAAAASAAFAFGIGVLVPALQALATETVPDDVRGGVLGLYQSSVGLATIASTAIAGLIFAVDPRLPYWIGAILAFLMVPPSLMLRRFQPTGQPATVPAPEKRSP